jgi:hypothetical protein
MGRLCYFGFTELQSDGSAWDCATRNGGYLPSEVHNHGSGGVAATPSASHRDVFFREMIARRQTGFLTIEIERFGQHLSKTLQELFFRFFLTIDSGNLFDPTNPPIAILLDHQ